MLSCCSFVIDNACVEFTFIVDMFSKFSRKFHTSQASKALPALFYVFGKPIARVAAFVIGRTARRYWRRLPTDQKTLISRRLAANRGKFVLAGGSLGAGLAWAYESHIQYCPVTGRRRFVSLYPDQIEKISEEAFEECLEGFKEDLVPLDHSDYERVARVSNRIINGNKDLTQIYEKKWTITVIDQPVLNAFVLPSGNIFIYRGMLDFCENDDQLAVIIGHEMSHAILGHVAEKLSLATLVDAIILIPMAVLWALLPGEGIGLVCDWFVNKAKDVIFNLPFSREMELEADKVGLVLAAKACYDVREAPALWLKTEVMKMEVRYGETEDLELFSEKQLEFYSTHPVDRSRFEKLLDQLPSALNLRSECFCPGLNPKSDPRTKVENIRKIIVQEQSRQNIEKNFSAYLRKLVQPKPNP